MKVTIKTIAELSGVSTGTVDRVLNRRGKVKPAVESRVLEIANALNYKPNSAAKILAMQNKKRHIGVISHVQKDYKNYAVQESFRGIHEAEEEIKESGISLIFKYGRNFNVDDQLKNIDDLVSTEILALAIAPINDPRVTARLDEVIESGIPVFCLINNIITKNPHYFIGIDNYQAGSIVAGFFSLLSNEKLDIAMIFPSLSMLGNANRLKGFEDTIQKYYPFLVNKIDVCIATNDDLTSYVTVKNMLKNLSHVNAIFFASGAAEGGVQAIKEQGLFGKATIIAVDPSDVIVENIIQGNISAVINQNTHTAGYQIIKAIYNYAMFNILPESTKIYIKSEIMIKEHFLTKTP